MNLNDIQKIIEDHLELITVDAKSLAQARERSAKFLIIQSVLATFLRDFEEEKAKVKTLETATYSQAIREADGKSITEKKISAEENISYSSAREALEKMEAVRDYVRTHIKIFENAHLFFRQLCRD